MGEDIAYLERFLVAEQILQVAELEIGIEQKRFDASFLCEQCAHGSDGALSCAATSAHDAYDVRTFDLRDDLLCGGFLRCSNGRYGALGVSLAGGVKSFRGGTGEAVPREKGASEAVSSGMGLAS